MRPKLVLVAAVAGAVLAACSGGGRNGDKPPDPPRGPAVAAGLREARLAPVVVVEARETIRVTLAFTNPSGGAVTYGLVGGDLHLLEGVLYRDGKKLKPNAPGGDFPPFRKEQVRELKPGKWDLVRYPLPHVKLEPGEYELRLSYKVHPKSTWATEFGFTPMELEQTILLEVRK